MADPVLVPSAPTISQPAQPDRPYQSNQSNQPNAPVDTSPGLEQVQRAFDRVLPEIKTRPSQPKEAPTEPVTPPETPVTPTPEIKPPPSEEHKIPSFLEDALKLGDDQEKQKAETRNAPEPDEEFPEDLPVEQKQSRIKGLRDAYKTLKEEVKKLKETPNRDPAEQQRLAWLENQNKQMAEALSRVGVEHSQEFQQNIIRPLTGAWNEAAKIVRDSGGDPQELAKAMSLNGRAQFEALDNLFEGMPESARAEAHDALRTYRRYEEARRTAVANAPKTLEALQARETERQYKELTRQRQDMSGMFDRALTRLRDEAKVEVFRTTDDPSGKWWNDQQETLIKQGRDLFLENTDMDKVALACLLAPAADAYRKLFIKSQQQLGKLQKMFKERIGNEPNLSESSGNAGSFTPESQLKEDLKKPFTDVFLREFHKSRSQGR